MAAKKNQENLSFEEAMKQLETLVDAMEQGDMPLEQSLESFEKGIQLTRQCQKSLQEAEQKVRILLENNEQADLEPFTDE